MRNFKKIAALALALSMILALVACGGPAATPAPNTAATPTPTVSGEPAAQEYVVIGNAQPLSGVEAQVGRATTQGVELAVKHINENGGLNGVPIRLINYDDQGTPEVAVQVAQRMLHQDNVDLIMGTLLSSNLMAIGDIIEEAGLLIMGTGTSPVLISQGWENMFRVAPNGGFSMPVKAQMAADAGWNKLAVFHGMDDSTKSGAAVFSEAAQALGLEIVATEIYADGDTDFAGQLARIIAANPDAVLLATNGPTFPLAVRQLRLMDYTGHVFFREAPTTDAVNLAGDAIDGVMFVYPYITYEFPEQADDPVMVEFLQKFYAEYGEMPFHDVSYRAWDGMMAIWEASKIAGSNDSASLIEAMHSVQFRGLGGNIDFTNGDREGHPTFRGWSLQEGRPVPTAD